MGMPPLDATHTTHFAGFDVVQVVSNIMSARLAELGLNIMAIGRLRHLHGTHRREQGPW